MLYIPLTVAHTNAYIVCADKNLAELSLVDESLEPASASSAAAPASTASTHASTTGTAGAEEGAPVRKESLRGGRSQYVLALYDAFANPKSGLINLVVEYMDGGSLSDLVQQGGCQEEAVLADVAAQVLRGLGFLHARNHMHVSSARPIMPISTRTLKCSYCPASL